MLSGSACGAHVVHVRSDANAGVTTIHAIAIAHGKYFCIGTTRPPPAGVLFVLCGEFCSNCLHLPFLQPPSAVHHEHFVNAQILTKKRARFELKVNLRTQAALSLSYNPAFLCALTNSTVMSACSLLALRAVFQPCYKCRLIGVFRSPAWRLSNGASRRGGRFENVRIKRRSRLLTAALLSVALSLTICASGANADMACAGDACRARRSFCLRLSCAA